MQTEILVLADGVLDWYNERKKDEPPEELKQLQVARDAQLAVIVGITICGCGRCGR